MCEPLPEAWTRPTSPCTRVRAGLANIAVAAIAVTLAGCSGGSGWQAIPGAPLSARGFGATACVDDGMVVWSGARPGKSSKEDVVTGAASYIGGSWRDLPDAPLSPRMAAGAGALESLFFFVWGGHDGTIASQDPDDFTYYADGAILNLNSTTWETLPPSPLSPRANPRVLPTGRSFLVYGGEPPPGPDSDRLQAAARYDIDSGTWESVAAPPLGSFVVDSDGLVAFSSEGVHRYDTSTDRWVLDAAYPDDIHAPENISADGQRVAGGSGSDVWIFDSEFLVLPEAPVGSLDYIGWVGGDVVIWDYEDRAAAIYDNASHEWRRHDAPASIETRVGSSICATESSLLVWAGWIRRDTFFLATDSGTALEIIASGA